MLVITAPKFEKSRATNRIVPERYGRDHVSTTSRLVLVSICNEPPVRRCASVRRRAPGRRWRGCSRTPPSVRGQRGELDRRGDRRRELTRRSDRRARDRDGRDRDRGPSHRRGRRSASLSLSLPATLAPSAGRFHLLRAFGKLWQWNDGVRSLQYARSRCGPTMNSEPSESTGRNRV